MDDDAADQQEEREVQGERIEAAARHRDCCAQHPKNGQQDRQRQAVTGWEEVAGGS